MHQSDDSLGKPLLDYEAWRALVRSICAWHNPVGIEPNAFLGWARPLSVCGLAAVDIGWNAHRIERTHRDALPIRIWALARWRPKRGSRYATSRSSLRRGTLPAVNSSIRFVWITPRAFCSAGRCWARASL
jgi:hypothetical protein